MGPREAMLEMMSLGFEREANVIKGGEPPHFGHSMFMILSWSLRLLEHVGCLASLQHCLVHRVSPFRDLTLSPGGLRVPAQVR